MKTPTAAAADSAAGTGTGTGLDTGPASAWRNDTLVVAAALFAWFAATAWMRPLMLPDEGRYVSVAWEMLRSGDWLTPTLDGLPFFHKPPLMYWLTAGAMGLLGPHEWAARAAPLLGGWGGAFALYLFLRRWWGVPRARVAVLVLAVQPIYSVGAQFANLDMLVAGCISGAVLCLAHAVLSIEQQVPYEQAPYRPALAGAYVLAALGVLAKGLIGAVIPALVVAVWLLALGRWRLLPRLLWGPGVLLFAAVAGPWFVAMQVLHPGFVDYFFVVQHFKRFAGGGFNNVQPFWFYPAVLLLVSLPWLPWLVIRLRQRLHDRLQSRLRSPTPPWRADPVQALMLVWAAVVVVFFSLPASKLLGYVLPALPPLACLMADGLASAWPRRAWFSVAVSALAGLGLVVALCFHTPHSTRLLAAALATRHQPAEPVFTLAFYPYDLPFYARLKTPTLVVDDWADPGIGRHDNWRKELADAAGFAPAQAAVTLIGAAALPAHLCRGGVSWVLGAPANAARWPFLAKAELVFAGEATLWRVDSHTPALAAALSCP